MFIYNFFKFYYITTTPIINSMKKYLLSIFAAGVISSVLQASFVALELWTFDEASGKSFQGVSADPGNGFANTGSNGSSWNHGSFGSVPKDILEYAH